VNYLLSVGGYVANSLAVMTDALHMLIDVASFIISLLAIWLGRCKPSKYMTFGWKRAGKLQVLQLLNCTKVSVGSVALHMLAESGSI